MKLFKNRRIKSTCLVVLSLVMLLPLLLAACDTVTAQPVYDTRLNFLTNSGMSVYRVV